MAGSGFIDPSNEGPGVSGSNNGSGGMPLNWGALAGGLGGLSAFGGLFGSGNNPADAGMGYFNQAMQTLPQYFQPYMNAGQNMISPVSSQYSQMMNDPGQVMNRIGSGYKQSPGYQFQLKQGMNAANSSAAAGGMGGTPMAQYNATQFGTGLANQDYYNYLNHATSLYGQGLQGAQGMINQGQQASSGLGEDLASILGTEGQTAYAGQANQNQQSGQEMGDLMGLAGTAMSFL